MTKKKTGLHVAGNTISGTAEEITDAFKSVTKRLQSRRKAFKGAAGELDEAVEVEHTDVTNTDIAITAASLKSLFCNYKYQFTNGISEGDAIDRKGANIVHKDLTALFKRLAVHLALTCEELTEDLSSIDIEKLPDWTIELQEKSESKKTLTILERIAKSVSAFNVTSFTVTGTGDNEGVVLTGSKTLSTGDHVGLTSPKTLMSGAYQYINELQSLITDLKFEVEQYMNGKCAPKMVQQAMFEDDDTNEFTD